MDTGYGCGVVTGGKFGDIGVQQHLYRLCRFELPLVGIAEARRRAEFAHHRLERSAVQFQQPDLLCPQTLLPERRIVAAVVDLNQLACPAVERRDIGVLYRPAAIGHPVALFEVDVDERTNPAAPAIGTAAQLSRPAGPEIVGEARIAALVERLRRRIEIDCAAFKQAGRYAVPLEFQREGNSGYAAPDNAYFRIQSGALRQLAGVDEHGRDSLLLAFPRSVSVESNQTESAMTDEGYIPLVKPPLHTAVGVFKRRSATRLRTSARR